MAVKFTYDFNTDPELSQVRMLIADTDPANVIFSDDEVWQALNMENSQNLMHLGTGYGVAVPLVYSVWRAAALLLDTLASNTSRLAGALMVLDIKLQTGEAAIQLRSTAKEYRDREMNSGAFAVVEMVNDDFSWRNRIWNQMLRQQSC